jgi:hypothetical protein
MKLKNIIAIMSSTIILVGGLMMVPSFAATVTSISFGTKNSRWVNLDYYPKSGIMCYEYINHGIAESGVYQLPKNLTSKKLLALKGKYPGRYRTANLNRIPTITSQIKNGNISMQSMYTKKTNYTGPASPDKSCLNIEI